MRYATGPLTEMNAIDRLEAYRIAECVYDLTTIATTLIHKYDIDVGSRNVFDEIYKLAEKFQNNYVCDGNDAYNDRECTE